jgi:hypothetical protein
MGSRGVYRRSCLDGVTWSARRNRSCEDGKCREGKRFVVVVVVTENANLLTMAPPETRSAKRRVTRSSAAKASTGKEEEKRVATVAKKAAKKGKKKQTGGVPVAAVARGKRIGRKGPFAEWIKRAKKKGMKGAYVAESDESYEENSGAWEIDDSPKPGVCAECSACGYYGRACPDCPEGSGFKCMEEYYPEVDEMMYSSD